MLQWARRRTEARPASWWSAKATSNASRARYFLEERLRKCGSHCPVLLAGAEVSELIQARPAEAHQRQSRIQGDRSHRGGREPRAGVRRRANAQGGQQHRRGCEDESEAARLRQVPQTPSAQSPSLTAAVFQVQVMRAGGHRGEQAAGVAGLLSRSMGCRSGLVGHLLSPLAELLHFLHLFRTVPRLTEQHPCGGKPFTFQSDKPASFPVLLYILPCPSPPLAEEVNVLRLLKSQCLSFSSFFWIHFIDGI